MRLGSPLPVMIDGKNAFEITYRLENMVREDIYEYITE